jgi:type 1 glutamine amidotransferase
MYRVIILLSFIVPIHQLHAQRVLHFTKTSGFDHNTREVSFAMFSEIAAELMIDVDDDSDGSTFSSLEDLMEYAVIVFSNTSGNAILTDVQRGNFEIWVAQGGRLMGIHAASDTYRHSTANGGDTGVWDFYAELLGGSVQANPHHVAGTPSYAMDHIGMHASTANLPDPWQKDEEYYYWENGYLHSSISPVLEVEETVGPNGLVNSYDAPRPMSWYRITATGRSFYTALGHAVSNYTDDILFRTHVRDALEWLLEDMSAVVQGHGRPRITQYFDPSGQVIHIQVPAEMIGSMLLIHDASGQLVHQENIKGDVLQIDVAGWSKGTYLVNGLSLNGSSPVIIW